MNRVRIGLANMLCFAGKFCGCWGMSNKNRTVSCMLVILLVLAVISPAAAAEGLYRSADKRVVRVVYPEQKYLTETDENGNYSGYSYEYLKKVAEFANWKLEYITFGDMTLNEQLLKGMEMVESGEADLVGVMLRNGALEEKYSYPEKNYGVVYTTLETLDTNFALDDINFMRVEKLRVAVLRTATTRNEELAEFAEKTGTNCEYVYCDTVDQQLEALHTGAADAMLKVSLTFLPNLKQIAEFAPRPFYFASTLGNEELVKELDEAISKINITDPYFESRLRTKYFQNTMADFSLSPIEEEYVRKNGQIKVLMLPQYAPFAFVDKNDQMCGISVSVLDDICEKTGINISYHVLQSNENLLELLSTGEYSIVIGPPQSTAFADEHGLILSQAYLETSLTMFTNKDAITKDKADCVLALLRDVPEPIGYKYKEIRYYDNIEDCLDAVNSGEADYGYATRYLMDFYTSQGSHKNLSYLNLSGNNREIGFFVPNTEDSALLSILNKYVRSMPAKDVHGYLALALAQREYGGIEEFVQENLILVVALSVVFLFLILLTIVLGVYNRVNKKRNERLRLAFSAKSDFLSRMSHDMRTPMNGIIGLTGLTLEMDGLTPEIHENLRKIDESANYLLSLINDTLDMNKIESNKIVLNKEAVNLNDFFEQMISVVKVSADQKNVELIAVPSPEELPLVYLDKVRVQQIFFNLLSNAIKFTPENGTVEVKGECRMLNSTQVYTKLTIKDSGIGIGREFLPKIFEPFEQEYNSATTNYSGTGLGLAIVKNLVDIMGGTISASSIKGVGSEFYVELIFNTADVPRESAVQREIPKEHLTGKRILLCEDHPLNAQIATKLLEKNGMVVELANNGQVAVSMFSESDTGYYDAILMDIRMPIIDGLEATKIIRGMERGDAAKIPIIAMTANAFDEDVQKSKAAGMNAHLAKPVEPEKMIQTLLELIESSVNWEL